MAIPGFENYMLPLLELCSDGQEHRLRDTYEVLAKKFNLTEIEKSQMLPSGTQTTHDNRVGWARTFLKKALLLDSPKRGWMKITERGRKVLQDRPVKIDIKLLDQFPEFVEFRTTKAESKFIEESGNKGLAEMTPKEFLDFGYQEIKKTLVGDLLQQVKDSSPKFFEKIVVDLLEAIGYGKGQITGKPGDDGIDGIIKEDKLGLDVIYIQAKRWQNNVGNGPIRDFLGALDLKRAKKGVFITTSSFVDGADAMVANLDKRVVLINGQQLAELMIDHGVGVTKEYEYAIKRIDSDYFIDE